MQTEPSDTPNSKLNSEPDTSSSKSNSEPDTSSSKLNSESETGNVEYKRILAPKDPIRLNRLITQLNFRLTEGDNEAIYIIGVDDDGTPLGCSLTELEESLKILNIMVQQLHAEVIEIGKTNMHSKKTSKSVLVEADNKWVAVVLIRRNKNSAGGIITLRDPTKLSSAGVSEIVAPSRTDSKGGDVITDIRIAIAGNVDAGKSTLVSVLTQGLLDDGRESARLLVVNHPHEAKTGQTSSIGLQILGFDSSGKITNYDKVEANTAPLRAKAGAFNFDFSHRASQMQKTHQVRSWQEIVKRSSKILSFVDLCGHEGYLKTTIAGICSQLPSCMLLCIGANSGISKMTIEHIRIACIMRIPIIAVMTKVDSLTPDNVREANLAQAEDFFKRKANKRAVIITPENAVMSIYNFVKSPLKIVPIFQVSNVSGAGLDLLKQFLNCIPVDKRNLREPSAPFCLHINQGFTVVGIGTVAFGIATSGTFRLGEKLMLGPDSNGGWKEVSVKSIQFKRVDVSVCSSGQSICMALKKVPRREIAYGMVLCAPVLAKSYYAFTADIFVLHHQSTIGKGFQSIINCVNVRQSAKVIDIYSKETVEKSDASTDQSKNSEVKPNLVNGITEIKKNFVIRSGDKATVKFQFLYKPEFLSLGSALLFREGTTRGVGTITELFESRLVPLNKRLKPIH